jgi:hypothetical protein
MKSKDCSDCHRLRERFWDLSTDFDRAKDELIMTDKNASDYAGKKADVLRFKGLMKDALIQADNHLETQRNSN